MNKRLVKITLLIAICFFSNFVGLKAQITIKKLCEQDGGITTKGIFKYVKTYTYACDDNNGNTTWYYDKPANECPKGETIHNVMYKPQHLLTTFIEGKNFELLDNWDYYCCEIPTHPPCDKNSSESKYYDKNGLEIEGENAEEEWNNQCVNPEPDPIPEPPKPDPDDACFDKDEEVGKNCKIDNPTSDVACSGEIKEDELCGVIAGTDNESYKSFSNDYCSIYCRRELKYEFEDKVKVIAGRYFRHSLSDKDEQINNLSGIIKVNYECGGQIKYNTWKKDWKKANEALIEAWNNYSYWKAIVESLSVTVHNKTCDSCDSQECTVHETKACDDTCAEGQKVLTVERKFTVSGGGPESATLYDYDSETRYISATCTSNCEFTTADCNNNSIGANYSSKHTYSYACSCASNGYSCTLKTGEDPTPKLALAAGAYSAALTRVNTLKQQILDCNDEKNFFPKATIERDVTACGGDGTTTSGYDENTIYKQGYEVNIADEKGQSSNIQKFCNKSSSWNDFCSDCDSEFNGETCETEKIPYYVCDESGVTGCDNAWLSVLNAGAIMAKYDDVTYHYQSAKHYTQLFTGKVTNKTSSGNDYLEMPDNAWPVAVDRKTGPYDICYEINLTDPLRDMKGGSATCEYLVTNELNNYDCSDGYDGHECHGCSENDDSCHDGGTGEDQDRYDSMGVFYRSVDLTDLFPNSKFSPYNKEKLNQDFKRVVGFNWINKDNTINTIQATGESIWTSEPEVTVTLTPSAIKKLKENNNVVGNYLDLSTGLECYADSLRCENTILSRNSSNNLFNILGTNSNGEDNLIINDDKFKANRYEKSGGDN